MDADRLVRDLRAVLPQAVNVSRVIRTTTAPNDSIRGQVVMLIAGHEVCVRWLSAGTLPAVRTVLAEGPLPDVIVAPRISQGARVAASGAGVGWVEETGAAEIALPFLVVSRTAVAKPPIVAQRWRRSHVGVTEALLEGTRPTVSAVADATGMSPSTVTEALAFLTSEGLLAADAARGRKSARHLTAPGALLDRYALAVDAFVPAAETHVGILSRDPLSDISSIGRVWSGHQIPWAATSAVAAAVLAPFGTQVAPMVVYVHASTVPQLNSVAELAGLSPIRGGRLTLRPFPTNATARLSSWHGGLRLVPWARCYADLVTTGIRGEDIATNLREVKLG